MIRQGLESDQQNQRPNLHYDTNKQTLIKPFRNPSPEQQVQNKNHISRDREQVRLKGTKTQRLELQGDVTRLRGLGDQVRQTEEVDGPEVVIAEGVPEELWGESFSVMHCPFAGVVAEDAVDHDFLLVFVEPAVFAAEAACGLGRGGGHPECGDDAD